MKLTMTLFALLALAGCATPVSPHASDTAKGLVAGCDTGYWRAGNWTTRYNKDEELYQNNDEYRKAWDKAYFRCYRREKGVDQ